MVGHIDADGITATSIAYKSLQDQHIDVNYNFIKKIDENEIRRINKIGWTASSLWTWDVASGQVYVDR